MLEEDGTGKTANTKLTKAAGKTGTAQTGVIKNGNKVTNSWFCGFFPLDNPKYAVTILSENAAGGCGDVFASIYDDEGHLFPIETQEEWDMVEEVLNAFNEDEEDEE